MNESFGKESRFSGSDVVDDGSASVFLHECGPNVGSLDDVEQLGGSGVNVGEVDSARVDVE